MFFADTLQTVFYITATVYSGLMTLVTLGAIIGALVVRKRVKRRIRDLKEMPLRTREFTRAFMHSLFNHR